MLNNHIFLFIFFLSFLSRLIFVIFFPETGGDSEIFITVAKNILRGCGVSLSDPASNECIPHFGGNHGPGYDIFMASVWYLFDQKKYFDVILVDFRTFTKTKKINNFNYIINCSIN